MMQRKLPAVLLILFLTFVVSFAGCARMKTRYRAHNAAASPSATPFLSSTPKEITRAELVKLRWIVGTWRGTGGDVPPFYERYKFENDTTLVVETLADETLSKVSDESRFVLRDGHFGSGTGDSGSVATALDDESVAFAPTGKGNFFRFQRQSDNSWKAILNWTDKNGAAKERVYLMQRWPAK